MCEWTAVEEWLAQQRAEAEARVRMWQLFGPSLRLREWRKCAGGSIKGASSLPMLRRATSGLHRCYPEAPFDCYRVPDDVAHQTVQFFCVLGMAFLVASRS